MATNNPDGSKLRLKYLFTAVFTDGSRIRQNPEDTSSHTEGRSSFYDVLKEIEGGKQLERFLLIGESTVVVDLRNGQFAINGARFVMHEEDLEDFRILYFRVRDTHFTPGNELIGYECSYRIGFQANVKGTGENVQRWMEIK